MSYFQGFPLISYKFGNEETTNVFTNISAYVEIIDQIKDNINYYSYYTIIDGDRPDTLSYKLYNTPVFYWTFFLANDTLKEQGWPLTSQQLEVTVKKVFPDTVLTTQADLANIMAVGQTVTGLTSGASGVITKRRLDLGQLYIKGQHGFINGEVITSVVESVTQSVTITTSAEEYNAIHHYEDADGNVTDIDPYQVPPVLLNPVTNSDRFTRQNDELKVIKILKPSTVNTVNKIFKQALAS